MAACFIMSEGLSVFFLLLIGYVAGLIAGVSPCILPILPVILVGWSAPVADQANATRLRRRRSLAVVSGLVISFSLITALGSVILSSLGLPPNFLRDAGIVLLVVFGLGLLSPRLETLLERPFVRFTRSTPSGTKSGFVLGLGLGLVFVPCAGPVLAAVSVLGARGHASLYSVLLSFFFGAGAATPLFFTALAGDTLIERNRRLATRARRFRPLGGALLILMALAITFNVAATLQRVIPGYTTSLQHLIEGNGFTSTQLRAVEGQHSNGSLVACENAAAAGGMSSLSRCGVAPPFTGISAWLNTPGTRPLTMAGLRGKVVLVDFWTYSCINCQRTLPHVEAWNQRYAKDGLVVVGVEAPEFAFEHSVHNVTVAAHQLGVTYPVAIDDQLSTWTAYANQYWPAEYLIDASGVIRHVAYGEGDYTGSENDIRALLTAAHPGLVLPPPSNLPDMTPTGSISPETYLGTARSQYQANQSMTDGVTQTFTMPSSVPATSYDLGGAWTPSGDFITAQSNAQLNLNFTARHVYLVLGGTGTVTETLNGRPYKTISVRGIPTLYTMFSGSSTFSGVLGLSFTPSVQAYDFTFG